MRHVMAGVALLLLQAARAPAVLQVDVAAELVPADCRDQLQAAMVMADDPASYPATNIVGPDGMPPALHLVFDYDASLQGGMVERIDLQAGAVLHSWQPPAFTVFYPQGPAFPVEGDFAAFPSCQSALSPLPGPTAVELSSIRPNPCNPDAIIEFRLSGPAAVRLEVLDLQGRVVALLREGVLPAGGHTAVFSGQDLPSGLYLAVLRAGPRVDARRLLLLR